MSARPAACSRPAACRPSLPVPGSKCPLARGCTWRAVAPRPAAGSCSARWTRRARSRSSAAPLRRSSSPSSVPDQIRSPGHNVRSVHLDAAASSNALDLIIRPMMILPRHISSRLRRGGKTIASRRGPRHLFSFSLFFPLSLSLVSLDFTLYVFTGSCRPRGDQRQIHRADRPDVQRIQSRA